MNEFIHASSVSDTPVSGKAAVCSCYLVCASVGKTWLILNHRKPTFDLSDQLEATSEWITHVIQVWPVYRLMRMRKHNNCLFFPLCYRVRFFPSPRPVQQQWWTGRGWRVCWAESINTPQRSGGSGCLWCLCSGCWCLWWPRRGFGATRAKILCVILDR